MLGPRVSGNAVSPPEVPSLVLMFLHCDCVQTRERVSPIRIRSLKKHRGL